MARIEKGILGGIKGNIGEVNGYFYKGIPVIRARRRKSNAPVTSERQLASLDRMDIANTFLSSMVNFVNIGFGLTEMGQRSNGYNAAKSYLTKNSIAGDYPNQYIDYSKVKITEGNLEPAINPEVEVLDNGIKITWDVNEEWNFYLKRSQLMVLIYCPLLNQSSYLPSAARRAEGNYLFTLPNTYRGKNIEVYVSFIADNRLQIADSTYIGSFPF